VSLQLFRSRIVVRRQVVIPALLVVALSASAQTKVSGGSTAPATGSAPTQTTQETKADPAPTNPPANRGATARKALGALKGGDAGKNTTDRKPDGK
jgi:hypothetical protein